jgi:hypothetical protein
MFVSLPGKRNRVLQLTSACPRDEDFGVSSPLAKAATLHFLFTGQVTLRKGKGVGVFFWLGARQKL